MLMLTTAAAARSLRSLSDEAGFRCSSKIDGISGDSVTSAQVKRRRVACCMQRAASTGMQT
eukprot:4834454-Pleurochrysis_carterae.AAC.1